MTNIKLNEELKERSIYVYSDGNFLISPQKLTVKAHENLV